MAKRNTSVYFYVYEYSSVPMCILVYTYISIYMHHVYMCGLYSYTSYIWECLGPLSQEKPKCIQFFT
jgi:hypothetical protein